MSATWQQQQLQLQQQPPVGLVLQQQLRQPPMGHTPPLHRFTLAEEAQPVSAFALATVPLSAAFALAAQCYAAGGG